MPDYSEYQREPDDNDAAPPVGAPEGNYAGRHVNDTFRYMMAVIRRLGDAAPKLGIANIWTALQTFNAGITVKGPGVHVTEGSLAGTNPTTQFVTQGQSDRADLGTLSKFSGRGRNASDAVVEYGALAIVSTTRTAGSEIGQFELQAVTAGAQFSPVLRGRGGSGVLIRDAAGDPAGGFPGAGGLNVKGPILKNGVALGTAAFEAASTFALDADLGTAAAEDVGTASGQVPLVGTASATEALAGLLEVATVAEIVARDSSRALTASRLFSAFASGAKGHIKFGPLIVNWNLVTGNGSADVSETFSLAFPAACRAVMGTPLVGAGSHRAFVVRPGTVTTTGFDFAVVTSSGGRQTEQAYYIAIGV